MREVSLGPVAYFKGMPSKVSVEMMGNRYAVEFVKIAAADCTSYEYFGSGETEYFSSFGEAMEYVVSEYGNAPKNFLFLNNFFVQAEWETERDLIRSWLVSLSDFDGREMVFRIALEA